MITPWYFSFEIAPFTVGGVLMRNDSATLIIVKSFFALNPCVSKSVPFSFKNPGSTFGFGFVFLKVS